MVGVDRPMKAPSVIYKHLIRGNLSKFSLLSFCQNIFFLNQIPSCICSMCQQCIGKVSNCSIKSCVLGFDRLMKAPSIIYKYLIRGKLSKFSLLSFCQKLFFLNQIPSCICSMCLHSIGKVSNCSTKSCGRS